MYPQKHSTLNNQNVDSLEISETQSKHSYVSSTLAAILVTFYSHLETLLQQDFLFTV